MPRFSSHLLTALISCAISVLVVVNYLTPVTVTPSERPLTDLPKGQTLDSHHSQDQRTALLLTEQQHTIIQLQEEIAWLETILDSLDDSSPKKSIGQATSPSREIWFDEQSLKNLSVPTATIANLKHAVEDISLQKLELRHQANREGWGRSRKLQQQIKALDEQLKSQLTPDELDLVLFATGRHNRVEVTDTIENSAAGIAGIRTGDIILSYDGQHIFEPLTLFKATADGSLGDMTEVIIDRQGEQLSVYVPRGSLGVRFKPVQRPPRTGN